MYPIECGIWGIFAIFVPLWLLKLDYDSSSQEYLQWWWVNADTFVPGQYFWINEFSGLLNRPLVLTWKSVPSLFVRTIGAQIKESSLYCHDFLCNLLSFHFCSGEAYFHGIGFVRPGDIPHSPTRLFYRHELFLSSIEAAYPFSRIIGRCAVLHIKEYFSSKFPWITIVVKCSVHSIMPLEQNSGVSGFWPVLGTKTFNLGLNFLVHWT